MKVTIMESTPQPIDVISRSAGCCYGKRDASYKRAASCYKSGHLGVFEHACVTFLVEGISRACSHQLVRHRMASFCVTGDTVIRSVGQKSWTVKELFDMQEDPLRKGRLKLIQARSIDESTNVIVPNMITGVHDSGVRNVMELTTESGRRIVCTPDHKIYTPLGYKKLSELQVGDYVYSNGRELLDNEDWLYDFYVTQNHTRKETAEFIGCCESLVNRAFRKFGIIKPRNMYPNRKPGYGKKGMFSDDVKRRISESKMGSKNPSWKKDRSTLSVSGGYNEAHGKYNADKCEFCGSDESIEIHHVDKNPRNNSDENIKFLCSKCHHLWHHVGAIGVFKDKVVSINDAGSERVYDISMAAPFFNFVANGIVVHNCQLSQRYKRVDTSKDDWFVIPDAFSGDFRASFVDSVVQAGEEYNLALKAGVKPEDARYLLPEATKTDIVVTMNWRELFHFWDLRCDKHAQWEIRDLAWSMVDACRREEDLVPLVNIWDGVA